MPERAPTTTGSAWTDPRVIAPSVITGLVIGMLGVAMNAGIYLERQTAAQEHTQMEREAALDRGQLRADIRVLTERVAALTMRIAELEIAIRQPGGQRDD